MRRTAGRGEENPTPAPPRAPTTARLRGASLVPARRQGGHLMIEARGLTKRYGDKLAVDDLTFTVRPGVVTGFLGPNGAGKSTTMRMILGLDTPTRGSVTVNGRPYREHAAPLREVGAQLLQPPAVHGPDLGDPEVAGGRGRRGGRPGQRGPQAGRRLLARHGPAPGHRGRAARRLAHGDPGRARQRPGHRGDPLDPVPAPGSGRRGADRLRLLAPDERDGHDRPAPDRDRPGAADRRRRPRGAP